MPDALRIVGLDEALAKLGRLKQPNLDKASQRVIAAAARSLVVPIRRQAPVDTGRLRASVSSRRGKKTRYPSVIVGPRARHRHLVILGTKRGQRPNSFVERGVQGQEDRLEKFVARQLEKELRL